MRYLLCLAFITFSLQPLALMAQKDITIRKKDFKSDRPGFEEAWKHVRDGDSYYLERGVWYGDAFNEYLQAIVYNNSNPELNYKTGVSALFSDNKEEAAGFLLKAMELKSDVTDDVALLTGCALQFSGRFSDAVAKFNEYLNSPGKKSKDNIARAVKCIEECKSALIVTDDTMRVRIENLGGNINSATDDYSEIFSADEKSMYFASRREIPKSGRRYPDTKFDENIFISGNDNGLWEPAIIAGKELATKYCEAPLYINATADELYVYSGYENGGDIKLSVNKKGIWRRPEPVRFRINSSGAETSFTFSPSGEEIFFVSDKGKENIGGKDIFYIEKLNDRKWSKPQNAGSVINSANDEESVRFSRTGDTLWFSSKGHNTIGGFDIFYSVRDQSGEWDSVRNAGYPVNTPWDEVFYQPSLQDDSLFYFVSNRSGGLGGMDIYYGELLPPEPVIPEPPPPEPEPKPDTVIIRDTVVVVKEVAPPPEPEEEEVVVLYLIGSVYDSETNEPVLAKIDVIDISNDLVVATTASSDVDGSYRIRLPEKKPYMIDLRATGFLADMKRIDIPDNWPDEVYNLDVALIKVQVGKKVVLNNILFETGNSILTSDSYAELDRLYNIMSDNTLMRIEVSGHTDNTGSESLNFRLSEERAKAVVEYLIQKGVESSRMEYQGFGPLQPIDDNSTSQGRAKNRRVEFKILEF